MFTQHVHDVGVPSYRDNSYKDRGVPIGARWVTFGHGIKEIFEDATVDRDKSLGDILGSVLVKPESRDLAGWFHAVPAVKTSNGFFPIRDRSFAPDTSFKAIDAAVPSGAQIPNGTPVIILCATKEDGEQELIVMSGGSGAEQAALSLIAANRNGPYEMGTSVYDLNDKGEADIKKQAKLQSAWKVMTPSYAPTSGSTGVPNFFNLAAQAKNLPTFDDQRTLLKIGPKNASGNKVNVGILPDGAGGIKFSKNGKQIDPFTYFGVGKKTNINFGGKGPGNVGVLGGEAGGIIIKPPAPGASGNPLGSAPGLVQGLLEATKPKITT